MGKLYYGADTRPIELDDRLLSHAMAVIATKLRRQESFTMTWAHESDDGRSTIWIQPSIPLRFVYDSAESASLDRRVLKELAAQANSSRGLTLSNDVFDDAQVSDLEPRKYGRAA